MNVLSKRLILTLAAATLAAAGAAWWILRDSPGHLTAGSTPGVWTLDQAAAFDGYPVFYLGKEFEGLPLAGVIREVVDDNPDSPVPTERDGFIFTYGDCTIRPGNDSCALPLSVEVTPRCYTPLELFPEGLKQEPMRAGPGGSEVQVIAAATYVWAGDIVVRIGGGGASHERAVEALQILNEAAVGKELASLSSPAKSVCAKIQGRDRDKVLSLSGGVEAFPTPAPEAASSGPQLDLAVTDNGTSLTVKVNLSGTVTPYAGAQITFHVPSALLQFSSGSTGLSSGTCVNSVKLNTPAPGLTQVNFGCGLLGSSTTSVTGTLLSVTMTEIGNGCAAIVMHTVPGGTTTNASGGGAQANTYGVTTAQIATVGTGGACPP